MKAQISRHSDRDSEHYSGVYQQQGRMLTDADWNELVEVIKRRQQQALAITVDRGVPRNGGVLEIGTNENGEPTADLQWGSLVVDGIYAEVVADETVEPDEDGKKPYAYDKQRFFPDAPEELDSSVVTYYADVWERLVGNRSQGCKRPRNSTPCANLCCEHEP